MPKRRRLFTPNKNKLYKNQLYKNNVKLIMKSDKEVNTARGRLMGALMDVLDPVPADETDDTYEDISTKTERKNSESQEFLTDEEVKKCLHKSPAKQAYVLKLFDRSVDLSQFREDSPLYPICRAWILNQPKADYSAIGKKESEERESSSGITLPRPEGPLVSRVPKLLEEQQASKDNINLNYRDEPLPTREHLLEGHLTRWTNVRQSWLKQAAKVEARYEASQRVLNKMNVEYLNA